MTDGDSAKYSVMELSELLGIKRTTVNDWLTKYAIYMGSSVQGKRRLYTDGTLNVLKKIAELRGQGLSAFEIEAELGKLYAVHPQPEEPVQKIEEKPVTVETKNVTDDETENSAIMIRRDAAELLRRFEEMSLKIERLENAAKSLPPPASAPHGKGALVLVWTLLILLIAGGSAVFYYGWKELTSARNTIGSQEITMAEQKKAYSALKEDVFVLNNTRVDLESSVKDLEMQVEAGKKEAERQSAAAAKELSETKNHLEELRKSEAARYEAEKKLQQEKYEKERLELLRQMDQLKHEAEKKSSVTSPSQDQKPSADQKVPISVKK